LPHNEHQLQGREHILYVCTYLAKSGRKNRETEKQSVLGDRKKEQNTDRDTSADVAAICGCQEVQILANATVDFGLARR